MFTGIVEAIGTITNIASSGTNKSFWIECPYTAELKIDQSIAHNGVCLTIEAIENNTFKVTAIEETIKKTNLTHWQIGDMINLERCMIMNGRLDGHIVQGHVDDIAICTKKIDLEGSWEFEFEFNKKFAALVIEKGSICVNGTSLTCFDVKENSFKVAIIPYTYEHTSINTVKVETIVNIEFDIIGKYILRMQQIKT